MSTTHNCFGDGIALTLLVVAVLGLAGAFGALIGGSRWEGLERERWQRELVARGHAEYYQDGDQTQWRWKATPEAKQ